MAHFAELDQNNIVLRVIVVGDDFAPTEEQGVAFCRQLYGQDTVWLQTSYNTLGNTHLLGGTPFRKNYAGIGFTYDAQKDAFIPPKPELQGRIFEFDENTCLWVDVTPSTFTGVTRV
jgi:hypothetical protein